jgi:hypothetical protein
MTHWFDKLTQRATSSGARLSLVDPLAERARDLVMQEPVEQTPGYLLHSRISRRRALKTVGFGLATASSVRLVHPATGLTADRAQAAGCTRGECLQRAEALARDQGDVCQNIPYWLALRWEVGCLFAVLAANQINNARCYASCPPDFADCPGGKPCGYNCCDSPPTHPPHGSSACQNCKAGWHCCVCREYDGTLSPNTMVNGGYSCSQYCHVLGWTVSSDTPC